MHLSCDQVIDETDAPSESMTVVLGGAEAVKAGETRAGYGVCI